MKRIRRIFVVSLLNHIIYLNFYSYVKLNDNLERWDVQELNATEEVAVEGGWWWVAPAVGVAILYEVAYGFSQTYTTTPDCQ